MPMGRLLALLTALLLGGLVAASPLASEPPTRIELEAALLFKFSKFVTWPADAFEDAKAPLVFGVVGDERDLTGALEVVLKGQTVQGRRVTVRAFKDLKSLGACHLLFADPSLSSPRRVVQALDGAPVLLVGARPHFAEDGGSINLYRRGGSLRFEINPQAARRAHVEISSKLLRLARVVEDSDQ